MESRRPPGLTTLPRNALQAIFNRLDNKSVVMLRAAGNKHALGHMSGLRSRINHTTFGKNAHSAAIEAVPFDIDAQPRILRLLETGARVSSRHLDEFVQVAYPHLPRQVFAHMLRVLMKNNGAAPTEEASLGIFKLTDVTYLHSLGVPLGGEGLFDAWEVACSPHSSADYRAAFEYRLTCENVDANFKFLLGSLYNYTSSWKWVAGSVRIACFLEALTPAFHRVSHAAKLFAVESICKLLSRCYGCSIDVNDSAATLILDVLKRLTCGSRMATDSLDLLLSPRGRLLPMSYSAGRSQFFFALLDALARNGAHIGLSAPIMEEWTRVRNKDVIPKLGPAANWLLEHCESKDCASLLPIVRFMDHRGIQDRMKRGWLMIHTWNFHSPGTTWSWGGVRASLPSGKRLAHDLDSMVPCFASFGTKDKIEFFKRVWEDLCLCSTRIPLTGDGAKVLAALKLLTRSDAGACTNLLSFLLDTHQVLRMSVVNPQYYIALLDTLKQNGGRVVVSPDLVAGWARIMHKRYTKTVSLSPFEMHPVEFLDAVGQWVKQGVSLQNQRRLHNALNPAGEANAWSQKIALAVPRIAKSINSEARYLHVKTEHTVREARTGAGSSW